MGKRDISELLRVCQHLRSGKDANSQSLAASLSTRQLVRIARRIAATPTQQRSKEKISDAIHKACLSRWVHCSFVALPWMNRAKNKGAAKYTDNFGKL